MGFGNIQKEALRYLQIKKQGTRTVYVGEHKDNKPHGRGIAIWERESDRRRGVDILFYKEGEQARGKYVVTSGDDFESIRAAVGEQFKQLGIRCDRSVLYTSQTYSTAYRNDLLQNEITRKCIIF